MMIPTKFHHLRRGIIWAFVVLSVALALYDGWHGGHVARQISALSGLGVLLLLTEACFIIGALLMVISAGEQLAGHHLKHWLSYLRYARREARVMAHRLLLSRQFTIGFWLNFIGAVGTSLILIIGTVFLVPAAGWGVLVIIGLDLLATLGWRIPLEIKRRQLIKESKHESPSGHR